MPSTRFEIAGYEPLSQPARAPAPPSTVVDPEVDAFDEGGSGVLGADDRALIADATGLPFRHICALRITANDGTRYAGTGWLVAPRVVVTAGHCLFLAKRGGLVHSVEVIPALADKERPYGSAVSTDLEVAPGWKDGDEAADYGAIFLGGAGFPHAGSFAFAAATDHALQSAPLNIAGYPVDRDAATRLYYHGRRVALPERDSAEWDPGFVFYETDTSPGQSGSPVWMTVEGYRVAVALHTMGRGYSNGGVRITEEVFARLLEWKHR